MTDQCTEDRTSLSDSPVILTIDDVSHRFTTNGAEPTGTEVLRNIRFSARRGEMICILGRSGCGKTTILKLIAGFISPTRGTVTVNGQHVRCPGPDRCIVFQEDALFPWLTVRENIGFGLQSRNMDRKTIHREVDRFLHLVGLQDFGDYLPKEISGGMKQRVAIARVLILQPEVLLMDEPFGALDTQTREEMQILLLSLWKKLSHTIIFVTHDVSEAVLLADRIILMGENPGHVREEVLIDLPRPRERTADGFFDHCRWMMDKISEDNRRAGLHKATG